jgi:Protein of unknown function (DUF2975)
MPDSPPQGLSRLSLVMAWLATIGIALWPALYIYVYVAPGRSQWTMFSVDHVGDLLSASVPLPYRLAALAFSLGAILFTLWALWSLRALLLLYAKGEVFSQRALKLMHNVAVAMFAGVVAGFVVQAPITFLLSWPLGPGHREIGLSFGSQDVATLFSAGVVLVIARVMREAGRLADENAKFV